VSVAGSSSSASAAAPLVLADLVATSRVRDVALVALHAGAIALAAQVAIPLPGSPVPITLQTLVVLLGAAALGPVRAAAGGGLFLALGVAGVPWFAVTGGATVGYLVGFVLAGALVGAATVRTRADRTVRGTVALMVVGNLVIYAAGATGLALVTGMGPAAAVAAGIVPFLVGDAAKLAVAAALLPTAWRLVDRADRG
jgi:biotin transport system substrate-specific component